MTDDFSTVHTRRLSRRQLAGLPLVLAGAALLPPTRASAAQGVDPFTWIRTMPETETLGQRAGQPVDQVGPVEADGALWSAMAQVPIKRGQWHHFTCEFDTAWCIMRAYGIDASLEEQTGAVGFDNRVVPYWQETPDGFLVYGGDIGEHFSGYLDTNLMSRATGNAMRKAFEAQGLTTAPVRDRAGIEQALNAGSPVFFKSTVDFLDWRPATWITPEDNRYPVVFSNDHALTVMGYNDQDVVIRDPLGPTSTNAQRPYQYRVSWERFLVVFASQGNDGVAVGPAPEPAQQFPGDGTGGAPPG